MNVSTLSHLLISLNISYFWGFWDAQWKGALRFCFRIMASQHMFSLLIDRISLQIFIWSSLTAQHLGYLNKDWLYHEAFFVPVSAPALIRLQVRSNVPFLSTRQLISIPYVYLMTRNLKGRSDETNNCPLDYDLEALSNSWSPACICCELGPKRSVEAQESDRHPFRTYTTIEAIRPCHRLMCIINYVLREWQSFLSLAEMGQHLIITTETPQKLQDQVSLALGDGFITKYGSVPLFSYTLNAKIGLQASPAAEQAVEEKILNDMYCKTFLIDGIQ